MRGGAAGLGLILIFLATLGGLSCNPSIRSFSLDFAVIDAKYSPTLDRLILVSDNPPALHVLDPRTGAQSTIALPATPICVGLTPEGTRAAVGHDGSLTIVDLASDAIVATYTLPIRVIGVVFTGQIAHALPDSSRPPYVQSIDLGTGQIVQQSSEFFPDTMPVAHPDGSRVYAVRGDEIDRYELQSGTLAQTSSSVFTDPFVTHSACGRLWLSEDGRRIITGCGGIFRTSPLFWYDMTFDGQLSGVASVVAADQSPELGKMLVLAESSVGAGALEVRLYEDTALGYQGSIPLSWPGRFVFFDGPGERFFIVMDQPSGNSAVMAWDYPAASFVGGDALVEPPAQSFQIMSYDVVDAEYSQPLNRIVAVSSEPPALHVLDPETFQEVTVTLPPEPTSVSVAPDGLTAAVGHTGPPWSGRVSLVDLVGGELLATWPVTMQVRDLILDGTEHAYTTSVLWGASGESLPLGIDLTTGQESTSPGGYFEDGKTRLKRHPYQPAMYLVGPQEGPGGLVRYDISTGVYHYARSVPTSASTYPPCSDLWIAEDGLRIFTQCGHVFSSSATASDDMLWLGKLPVASTIRHLDHSHEAAMAALINDTPVRADPDGDRRVDLYDESSLLQVGSIPLPDFATAYGSVPARGRFVFFDAAGRRLYVIVRATGGSGLLSDYGLVSFDVPH